MLAPLPPHVETWGRFGMAIALVLAFWAVLWIEGSVQEVAMGKATTETAIEVVGSFVVGALIIWCAIHFMR